MKKFLHILTLLTAVLFSACSSGFDAEKAEQLLQKQSLSEEEYTELIKLYEKGIDKTLDIAGKEDNNISEKDRNDIIVMFAVARRLTIDADKLSEAQQQEFDRITKKGTEELTK